MAGSLRDFDKYDSRELEGEVRMYWEEKGIPQRVHEQRVGKKKFFLLDGPPYVNAEPHIGHAKTTACKDVWSRFKLMQGFDSFFIPGFDCHGLPVEVMVEKELGIKSKKEIEEMGVKEFDRKCLEKVLNNEKIWLEYYKALGAWRAYSEPYFTYRDYYIESAWWTAKTLYEKGLFAEGKKSIHWCPHCETAVSGYEVSDSYKEVTDPSIFVKAKLKTKGGGKPDNEFLLFWTTTPWTLPANVAIAAHPDENYVKVVDAKAESESGEKLIFAEKRLESVEKELEKKFKVLEKFLGKEMEGWEYEPVMKTESQEKLPASARRVCMSITLMKSKKYKKHMMREEVKDKDEKSGEAESKQPAAAQPEEFDEFVTMSDGTGLVHCAPGHGSSDNLFGQYYGLPMPSPVDERGEFTSDVSKYKGKFVKDADPIIIEELKASGTIVKAGRITHSYPLCWRCKSPLIFRLSPQWFLQVDPIKDGMLEANEGVKWMPAFGRVQFHNWLADRDDWCVSQQRFWGIPMNIWVCGKCEKKEVIGSVEELKKKATNAPMELVDLHRHTVDAIELKCSCGGSMKRVKDIFNVWFDSGIAPWASFGYPQKNRELFEELFPVSVVNESQDQVRGWFDSLMFCSMATFGKSPYERVAMMGWVVDEKGEKMSKSVGNVVPAKQGIEKLGADVVRLYYCWEISPWDVQKFSFTGAEEVRKALNIFWNSFTFLKTYGGTGSDENFGKKAFSLRAKEDKWIYSRLNSVAKRVSAHLDEFEFHLAGRTLLDFVLNDYSRWFVKLSRDRVSSEGGEDSQDCLSLMRYSLVQTAKLFAPITPFISEYIYQKLSAGSGMESVHYEEFPVADEGAIDSELEEEMALAMRVTEAANSARQAKKVKLRWPVAEVVVSGEGKCQETVSDLQGVLRKSCNALEVRFEKEFNGGEEFACGFFEGGKAFVSLKRDESLWNQSLFKELVRAVQESRKTNGLKVQQRVSLTAWTDNKAFLKYLKENSPELAKEVGANKITVQDSESDLTGEKKAEVQVEETRILAKYVLTGA